MNRVIIWIHAGGSCQQCKLLKVGVVANRCVSVQTVEDKEYRLLERMRRISIECIAVDDLGT
jgi:hypothetical protein